MIDWTDKSMVYQQEWDDSFVGAATRSLPRVTQLGNLCSAAAHWRTSYLLIPSPGRYINVRVRVFGLLQSETCCKVFQNALTHYWFTTVASTRSRIDSTANPTWYVTRCLLKLALDKARSSHWVQEQRSCTVAICKRSSSSNFSIHCM